MGVVVLVKYFISQSQDRITVAYSNIYKDSNYFTTKKWNEHFLKPVWFHLEMSLHISRVLIDIIYAKIYGL